MKSNGFQGPSTAGFVRALLLCGGLSGAVSAQSPVILPKPDKDGWIRIFRGDNTADFSVYTGNGVPSRTSQPFGSPFFVQGGDTIRTSGSPNAQLIFRQNFSHYRMQVQLRWPGNLGNTGVMTKLQWGDTGQGGGLPRAVECQGDPGQGMGQIWALGSINGQSGGTWITVRARMVTHPFGGGQAARADSASPEMDYGGVGSPSNNLIIGFPGWQQPRPAALNNGGWVSFEVESHGHDTTRHFIDGQKVMEYRNPRIAPRNNANSIVKRLTEGMLSVQSEGTQVWYRGWRIKLLPEDPLYSSLYGPPVTLAPRSRPESRSQPLRLGFRNGVLSVLSGGIPAADIAGRRFEAVAPALPADYIVSTEHRKFSGPN